MAIVIAILVFCTIILVHELGHFIAAKACGIYVKEFAFGWGPALFRKKGKETEFTIRAFPLGGFCAFEGETEDPENAGAVNPRAFNARPVWQRMIVILAGPVMNFLLGMIVVLIMLLSMKYLNSRQVYGFYNDSVSSNMLMSGDEIVSIDGMPIFTSTDISYKLRNSGRKNDNGNLVFDFKVKRDGRTVTLRDVEFMVREENDGAANIYFDFFVKAQEKNFGTVLTECWRETLSTSRLILMTLVDLVRGKYGLNELSGPVGVGTIITEAVSNPKYSLEDLLYIISLITINLGVFNLLPIPGLDGAKFVFLLIELIRRKPVKPEVEGTIHAVGMLLTLVLFVVVTFNDISKLFTGGFDL